MASNMLRSTLLKNLRTVRPVPVGTALPARTLTTSPYLLAKSSKPTTPPAGSKKKASLAERPSDVPDSISSPGNTEPVRSTSLPGTGETFEPIVNDMRTSEGPHPVDSSATVDPTHTPTGEASNTTTNTAGTTTKTAEEVPLMVPEEPYQIPDKPDLSKLPSLDIGFDTPRSQTPAQIDSPESEGSSSGTGPSGRTGAKAKPSLSSIEQRRRNFTRFLLLSGLVGSGVGAYVLANKEDDRTAGEEALGAWERFKNNLSELMDVSSRSFCLFRTWCVWWLMTD
jgi:import inner membrane translocase subunit TIM50